MTAVDVLDEIIYGAVEINSMGRLIVSNDETEIIDIFFGKNSRISEGEIKPYTHYIYDYQKQLDEEPDVIIKAHEDEDTIYLYELDI